MKCAFVLVISLYCMAGIDGCCQKLQCHREIHPDHHWLLGGGCPDETSCSESCTNEELPETDVSPTGVTSQTLPTIEGPSGSCALYLDRSQSDVIDFGEFANTCLTRLELCNRGLTLSVWLKIDTSLNGRTYYVSSGGQTAASRGISILGSRNYNSYGNTFVLQAYITDLQTTWTAETSAVPADGWAHVAMTWSKYHGLRFFIDGQLQQQDKFGTIGSNTQYQYTRFMVGRPNSVANYFGTFGIYDLKIFYRRLEDHDIAEAFSKEAFP